MLTSILIICTLILGGFIAFKLLKKDNPELRIFKKHYSCSICGSEFNQTLDYCPKCAEEKRTTVMLHEFFIEVKPGKKNLELT